MDKPQDNSIPNIAPTSKISNRAPQPAPEPEEEYGTYGEGLIRRYMASHPDLTRKTAIEVLQSFGGF